MPNLEFGQYITLTENLHFCTKLGLVKSAGFSLGLKYINQIPSLGIHDQIGTYIPKSAGVRAGDFPLVGMESSRPGHLHTRKNWIC